MSIATHIFTNINFSRILTQDEIEEFRKIDLIELKDFGVIGNKVVSIQGEIFDYFNSWRIVEDKLTLNIIPNEEEHLFVESLIYLIENFFNKKQIYLNGEFYGYDDVFGQYFKYQIVNNMILYKDDNSIDFKLGIEEFNKLRI